MLPLVVQSSGGGWGRDRGCGGRHDGPQWGIPCASESRRRATGDDIATEVRQERGKAWIGVRTCKGEGGGRTRERGRETCEKRSFA